LIPLYEVITDSPIVWPTLIFLFNSEFITILIFGEQRLVRGTVIGHFLSSTKTQVFENMVLKYISIFQNIGGGTLCESPCIKYIAIIPPYIKANVLLYIIS